MVTLLLQPYHAMLQLHPCSTFITSLLNHAAVLHLCNTFVASLLLHLYSTPLLVRALLFREKCDKIFCALRRWTNCSLCLVTLMGSNPIPVGIFSKLISNFRIPDKCQRTKCQRTKCQGTKCQRTKCQKMKNRTKCQRTKCQKMKNRTKCQKTK